MPYVQQLMILILKSIQNQGVTIECRERFSRRLALAAGGAFPSSERRKMTGVVEELSVTLSR